MATSIYYLLTAGEVSRWHAADADELWHWYEGEALELLRYDPRDDRLTCHRLGPVDADSAPVSRRPGRMLVNAPARSASTRGRLHGRAGLRMARLPHARGCA